MSHSAHRWQIGFYNETFYDLFKKIDVADLVSH